MSFFSDFAAAFNEVSDCTFNTIIVQSHAQSNKVGQQYKAMLADPDFRTTAEVKDILKMSSKDARKAFNLSSKS